MGRPKINVDALEHLRGSSATFKNYLRSAAQSLKRGMLRLGVAPPPLRVQIDITDRCIFRCPTCSKWRSPEPSGELGAREWGEIFARIRSLPLLREVSITGGEPFARPDIFEILNFAKRQKLYTVVVSNGWLVDRDVLRVLGEIGVDRVIVSLNSLSAAVHDSTRGVEGSFERIMDLVAAWRTKERPTDLCIVTVVMEPNCGELSSLAAFVGEMGLTGIIFQVLGSGEAHYPFSRESHMPPSQARWYDKSPLWVKSAGRLRGEIQRLLLLQRKGWPIQNPVEQLKTFPLYYENPDMVRLRPCLGTLSTMYIDPYGDIRLCYGYPPIGNILVDDPAWLWRGEEARKVRLESRKCRRLCRLLNNNL